MRGIEAVEERVEKKLEEKSEKEESKSQRARHHNWSPSEEIIDLVVILELVPAELAEGAAALLLSFQGHLDSPLHHSLF